MSNAKEMGFISACKEFFGMLPGQTLLQFREEIAKLTSSDRAEISAGLEQNGFKIKAA